MAAKKKSKKKTRTKKSPAKKTQTRRIPTGKKSLAKKKSPAKKKAAQKKKAAPKKKATRAKPANPAARRAPQRSGQLSRAENPSRSRTSFDSREVPALSGDADSQGLSNVEEADSESVSELLEEGNTFEAEAVSGVERADNAEGKEVRTREFPEDDVPEEYLDEQ